MPERSPSSAATGVTWRLADVADLTREADARLRETLVLNNAAGFLLGYYAMYNQWIQLGWFAVMTALWFWVGGFQDFMQSLRRDRWMMALLGLVFLLLTRSSMIESPGMSMGELWLGWFEAGMLMAVLMMLWQAASIPRALRVIGLPLAVTATATAIGSILIFYVFDSSAVFGVRLRNWFVFGGWNSVCTGFTFGFAAIWSVYSWHQAGRRATKLGWLLMSVILIWATLMTMSRGALLAMVLGHAALWAARGWRCSWRQISLLVSCILLFQMAAPFISRMGAREISSRLGIHESAVTTEMMADGVIDPNPVGRFVARADNGRFEIYQAAIQSMTTWQDWLLGKGLWSANDFWSCSLAWYPEHLHSIFMDALVRGGIPTLLGLLAILACGLRRCFLLARDGEELWLMLASFGCAGVIFDGDSAFSLLTIPRFETLILWVPLVIASARYTIARRSV